MTREVDKLSGNERLVAMEIIRQVLLLRHSLHVRTDLIRALNDTEQPISSLVRDALAIDAGIRDPLQVMRLNMLIDQINRMRAPAWQAGTDTVVINLTAYAEADIEDEHNLLVGLAPTLGLTLPGVAILAAAAVETPYQGSTFRQWIASARAAEQRRIREAIFAGVGAGEDPATVARRIVGRASLRGADGVTQTSRNHVDTLIRTALTNIAMNGRGAYADANREALTTEQFVAVLDGRTTQMCRSLNGKRFPIGTGPRPPLHMGCRSMRVIVLPEDVGGPAWEPEVYDAWIRRQPDMVKVELLGATRKARAVDGAAFKDYGSRPMTLKQVRASAARLMGAYN